MNVIEHNGKKINADTGEVVTDAEIAYGNLALELAHKSHALDMGKADLVEQEEAYVAACKALLDAQFPHLNAVRQRIAALDKEVSGLEGELKAHALEIAQAGGGRNLLGGLTIIKETKKFIIDDAMAIAWAEEMNRPHLLKKTPDKDRFKVLVEAGDFPAEVARIEVQLTPALYVGKLNTLLEAASGE